ncbi:MAG: TetR/AcrR family transcriptional regulator [Puniceicoccales bacterium]|jgi:AcrR family transcriptional regulator|nr:TetR/AcrR family transcriptional regulator [Puniceicoccales bacterium]
MSETETTILRAAQSVFLKKGLERTSMNDIAKQACISRPVLHYYHRTKRALFHSILIEAVERIIPKITTTITSDLSLMEKAGLIIEFYHQILLENPALPHFFITEIHRDPNSLLTLLEKHGRVGELLSLMQEQHAKELQFDLPPKEALTHFFITLYGILFFPFITKPLLDVVTFKNDPVAFHDFISGRKALILAMLTALLKPVPPKN